MYNRNVEPSDTNCPIAFFVPLWYYLAKLRFLSSFNCLYKPIKLFLFLLQGVRGLVHLGGYSDRVPPLPIPNREVKPVHVDGTAARWESR